MFVETLSIVALKNHHSTLRDLVELKLKKQYLEQVCRSNN